MCCDWLAMTKPLFLLTPPELQIGFAHWLVALQQTHLQPALLKTVADMDIAALDQQLVDVMPAKALQKLASFGLRGEALFLAPMVLPVKPTLLTYYRTL